jgi:hypothetical protein
MLKDIYENLKQVLVITETQKRQEEDIKELKKFMIEITTVLQRITDRIEMTDARTKSDLENLAKQTQLELENLALRMQLAAREGPLKLPPVETKKQTRKSHPGKSKTPSRKNRPGKKRKQSTMS